MSVVEAELDLWGTDEREVEVRFACLPDPSQEAECCCVLRL